ncbi:MAG: 3-dehydroquinate synthase [Flavobacteriales bacterium]|nr:3-dehydroquinate synthase [Flavobacteriales bacterium]MBT6699844.1 3-dehydroquinate synthase [Flavobacteriales bacterium]MBT7726779.1 3-dehydroquinate synthase [Flavobacteriales bacterium]
MKEIKADNYSVWIGENSISKLDVSQYSKIGILVDENTKEFCLPLLSEIKKSVIIEIKSGEENKNIDSCNLIWEALTKNCFDRNSLLINLGGGVIGDMGGFCASTYKRGIEFIQIPTSLLAMVDASVGGKLGVDFNGLKNQVGLFSNPKSVIINPKFLETLPEDELRSGFAEVVKHALIVDKNLWNHLKNNPFQDLDWEEIIESSVQIKNKIVMSDPKEKGERKKLNFGHTFGHAIESYYLQKGTPILHGEAIFVGIILESELSSLSVSEKNDIKNYILSNFSLPYTPSKSNLLNFLRNDKKNFEEKINFSLLEGIGNCTINNLFSEDEL